VNAHPPFGTLVGDSLYADGKGNTLSWAQYKRESQLREAAKLPEPDVAQVQRYQEQEKGK
jgi:hypothetical protein